MPSDRTVKAAMVLGIGLGFWQQASGSEVGRQWSNSRPAVYSDCQLSSRCCTLRESERLAFYGSGVGKSEFFSMLGIVIRRRWYFVLLKLIEARGILMAIQYMPSSDDRNTWEANVRITHTPLFLGKKDHVSMTPLRGLCHYCTTLCGPFVSSLWLHVSRSAASRPSTRTPHGGF